MTAKDIINQYKENILIGENNEASFILNAQAITKLFKEEILKQIPDGGLSRVEMEDIVRRFFECGL